MLHTSTNTERCYMCYYHPTAATCKRENRKIGKIEKKEHLEEKM